jgi:hypothetical protein
MDGMNISVTDAVATSVELDEKNLWVHLADGRQLGVPLVYFPRLLNAKKKDLNDFQLSGGGRGIHWEKLDEDISVKGLLLGLSDQTKLGKTLY